MIERIPRWLLIVGIVTVVMGCDNVSWGGMSLRLEGPPGDTSGTSSQDTAEDTSDPGRIEYGPLLYAAMRTGDSARVVPVAELVEGQLRPIPQGEAASRLAGQILEERLNPGRELTLFHLGSRVGTITMGAALRSATPYCPPRAEVMGNLELIPSASEAQRFLALEEPQGRAFPHGSFMNYEVGRAQRNAAQNLAGEALNELRAQWPAGLQNIRRDLQLLPLSNREAPSVVATFLFQDQLEIGPAPEEGYSLLILGEPSGTRFERTYTWFRSVEMEGKGAPRFFSLMDWDQDGEDEILLEVFGAESRWWAALHREAGRWGVSFQDACGAPETSGSSADGTQGDAP